MKRMHDDSLMWNYVIKIKKSSSESNAGEENSQMMTTIVEEEIKQEKCLHSIIFGHLVNR